MAALSLAFSLHSSVFAAQPDAHFDAASRLQARGKSIGDLMTRYKPVVHAQGDSLRRADMALWWSTAETVSVCAILTGDLVGNAGFLDVSRRQKVMTRINESILLCQQLLANKIAYLDAAVSTKSDRDVVRSAMELKRQFQLLDTEYLSIKNVLD